MKRVADSGSDTLTWVQAANKKREYQLLAGKAQVGSLRWEKAADYEAVAEVAEGSWQFRRKGFLRPVIAVRMRDLDSDSATFEVEWTGGGRVKLAGGDEYRWGPANLWRTEWAFAKPGDPPAVTFRPDTSLLKSSARVHLGAGIGARSETPLLIAIGWYLLVLMLEDTTIVGL